jgi:ATP-binding cassette subfamily B protein
MNADIKILKRLLKYLMPYKLVVVGGILFAILFSISRVILPYITKIGIDNYIYPKTFSGFHRIIWSFVGALVLSMIFLFLTTYFVQLMGQLVVRDLRVDVFSKIQRLEIKFFDKNKTGTIVTRLTNDCESINQFFSQVVCSVFIDIFLFVGTIIAMLRLNFKLSLIVFTVLPPLILLMNLFKIKIRKAYRERRKWLAKVNANLNETFTGIKVIKIFAQEKENYKRFEKINYNLYKKGMDQVIIYGMFMPLVSFLLFIGIGLIVWHGGGNVITGGITLGTLAAFLQYIYKLFYPIEELANKFNILQLSLIACERVFGVIDTKEVERKEGKELRTVKGEIEFRNVWFRYGEENNWVLKSISFYIAPGERVALVGPTGGGKTSIISLLMQFYAPTCGKILVDGEELDKISPQSFRKYCALVLQEDYIFARSIKENINLKNNSKEEVESILKTIGGEDVLKRWKRKLNRSLVEEGVSLSYGEKQLISLARAIASNPKIVILDEATREIDPYTDEIIKKGIKKLLRNTTAIIVAHRLSTIKEVDRIIVIENGEIVEEGTHEELLERNGRYRNLYLLQCIDECVYID